MIKEVFEFKDYRDYLKSTLDAERGRRAHLAQALRVQPAFVSRVLAGQADFSQEHGILINGFLQHREQESEFFMTLLDLGRAGSKALRDYHLRKLEMIREKRLLVSERIGVKQSLSKEDQMTYYSAWYYAAIHILLLVREMNTPKKIAEHLNLPGLLVKDVLDFLVATGLASVGKDGYGPGVSRIHLTNESPMISKHHTNWRIRAIEALEKKNPRHLHYSGPICISHEAADQIREKLLRLLSEIEPLIRDAKEEDIYCLDLDFFKV